MSDKLAFPGWTMGQVLLPEQFLALQETIVAHVDRRVELLGPPCHGLARLRWSEDLLAGGSIRIDALTWVFESGLLLDVPGNAVVGSLNLGDVKTDEVSIFLHVSAEPRDAAGLALYSDDEPSVARVIHRVELSLHDEHDHARESGKLAELRRTATGWALGSYSPPLLRLGRSCSPFLLDTLARTQRAVERLERHFAGRSVDAFLGADQLAELRRVRASAYRVLALLADHGVGDDQQEVALHPYVLFSALRDFNVEVAILQGDRPEPWPIRYRHDALAECYDMLVERIDRHLGDGRLLAPRLEFERKAEWFVTATFPDELCRATNVYLMAQPGPSGNASLEGVKLASPHRIEEVHTKALAGVRLVAIQSASLSHTYGRESSFYEVRVDDPEWQAAVRERALCFRAWSQLEGMRAALVWGG